MESRSLHMVVTGRVQGVFYRANTRDKAVELGLAGWVRNLGNGGVEVFAEGAEDKVKELLEYCKNSPGYSRVEDVRAEWGKSTGKYDGFRITH